MTTATPTESNPLHTVTPYELLGGEAMLALLVDRFYNVMDHDPAVAEIRRLHPADLEGSRQKLFMFLSGWLGGPNLYMEQHGHPRLRARHLPFPINQSASDQWMYCMEKAFEGLAVDPTLRDQLMAALRNTANFMQNQQPHP